MPIIPESDQIDAESAKPGIIAIQTLSLKGLWDKAFKNLRSPEGTCEMSDTNYQEEQIKSFFTDLYSSGTYITSVVLESGEVLQGVRVGEYNLISSNCTTLTIDSLPDDSILETINQFRRSGGLSYTVNPPLVAIALDQAAEASDRIQEISTLHP
ncbi:hypothetical protein PN498_17970 [Oscillatoria sp. CS-180]|uniref:hypothetical protein n=1 Tax=Oscillatoria sp. CS-180 TaxID=3021720 RepID=UPI0023310CC6|nr:hypothetical protein [Oscillatoria sp. CS-180]MDB9527887.1 hypothetical protein [Oscillatoria sp. CS-180]